MWSRIVLPTVLSALLWPVVGQAAVVLTLSSSAPDLSALQVGETVTFQVNLSGLAPGEQFDYLAVQVQFAPALLAATSIAPGSSVPDATGFVGSLFSGAVDGNYDSLFATTGETIKNDGVFYSFDVTVTGAGRGTLSFGLIDGIGSGPGGSLGPPGGGESLSFTSAETTAVPGPASGVLLLASVVSLLGYTQARQWRQASAKEPR